MTSSRRFANNNRRHALVVGERPVNRIVVSRIVEGTGMVAQSVTTQAALALAPHQAVALVIVDGGADDSDGADVIDRFSTGSGTKGGSRPKIIFLSAGKILPESVDLQTVDAVVPKPLKADLLEAAIFQLLKGAG